MIHEFCVKHNYSKRPKSRSRESRTSTNWRHQTEIKTTNGFHLPAKLIFNGFFVHLKFISSENCPCKLPSHFRRLETELPRLSFDAYCTITNSRGEMIIDWLWSSSALWLHGNHAGFRLSKDLLKFQLEMQLCSLTRNWCTAVNSQRWGGRGKFRWVIKLLQLSW